MKLLLCLPALFWAATTPIASAGSATWSSNPISSDWNTAANWVPNTVPNRQGDTATFASSNQNVVSFTASGFVDTKSIVFNSGASLFTINLDPGDNYSALTLNGPGIINNSGSPQNFVTLTRPAGNASSIYFLNTSSAGTLTTYTNQANPLPRVNGGSAGGAIFTDRTSAGSALFINEGATVSGALGGKTDLIEHATGAEATFVSQGGSVIDAAGGVTGFYFTASAGGATLIANGGTDGGGGGQIIFGDSSTGGTARLELFGNGFLDLGMHTGAVTVGSIEGDGFVELAGHSLSVGSNNLSTTFSGVIEEGSSESDGGAITKVGTGTLTLSGANTYTGSTTVSAGVLLANTERASSTGSGSVSVTAGTLGGKGMISGPVTVGTGSGSGAILAPSVGSKQPLTLSLSNTLTCKADSTYTCQLSTSKKTTDEVIANRVSIASGAQFALQAVGNKRLPGGTVFTLLSNTSATPISGTFANLPDGSALTVGRNKLLVSYTGGDGNDLTLTVQ